MTLFTIHSLSFLNMEEAPSHSFLCKIQIDESPKVKVSGKQEQKEFISLLPL